MSRVWMKPVSGPQAWKGPQFGSAEDWIERFSDAELADIERGLRAAQATGLPLAQIGREHFPLTIMADRLERITREVRDGRGFVVARGIPVSRYSDEEVGLIFWGLGRYMGTPLHQNANGDLLGHVYDHGRKYGEIDVRGYEGNGLLPYHTDNCDIVGLLCLRQGISGGGSSLVSSVTVHNEILAHHPEYLGLLYNGFYYIRREEALGARGWSDTTVPVFGCRDGVISCRYIRNQINAGAVKRGIPLTRMELEALDYFDSLTCHPDLRVDMDLEPGDVQFCNNYTTLHSRTAFVDGPEPHQKRHMVRLWLKFFSTWPISDMFHEQLGYLPARSGTHIQAA